MYFSFCESLIVCTLVIIIFQISQKIQHISRQLWLNPLLISVAVIISVLEYSNITFDQFSSNTQMLSYLIEPAIVALGLPLYQQIATIKKELINIIIILSLAITLVITVSILSTMLIINEQEIAVSLALKSITTPIGLALTEDLQGLGSITAIAIIIAGMTGAVWGINLLKLIGINNAKAQGLAIGCGSHALGTVTISSISYYHSAYSSLALVLSAIITSFIAPVLIPYLFQWY